MSFYNKDAGRIADQIILIIQENKQYLSEIDGAIGDGDHGINMSKGMHIAQDQLLLRKHYSMSEGLEEIQKALMNKIGGSMGPLYGMVFRGFVTASKNEAVIDGSIFANMLSKAYENLTTISEAKIGDKTLVDVLAPAQIAYQKCYQATNDMDAALQEMMIAAKTGLESTKYMAAKLGRASRLGERSIGHQDAGATSCTLMLEAMSLAMMALHKEAMDKCSD